MFSQEDLKQMKERGSNPAIVEQQINNFKLGFPPLHLEAAATIGNGMIVPDESARKKYIALYEKASSDKDIIKFVPASGAASRMFKDLFSYLDAAAKGEDQKQLINKTEHEPIKLFFDRLGYFAFKEDLREVLENRGLNPQQLIDEAHFEQVIDAVLSDDGLQYGSLPKGLLSFHKYKDGSRTPVEEHLTEGAHYAKSTGNIVKIHFTVSPEHEEKFAALLKKKLSLYEQKFSVKFDISFSQQKAYTDTIAVDLDNEPFRNADGSLLFRPAGHGALIENLNDLSADIIFIKNIDNVVPDKLKETTYEYKKVLAGVLIEVQSAIFSYLEKLDSGADDDLLNEIQQFLTSQLCIQNIPTFSTKEEKLNFLRSKLQRPVRVCGMVKNEGEPGGGPFIATNADGTASLQVVESSQIDFKNAEQAAIAHNATHFNPVDLVCGVKDYKGKKFDLPKHVDPATGFISTKSKDGKPLKALEMPGLWNGAMSDWNTLFVEVPIETFNPVKTVNDLLRPQHQ